MSSYKKYSIIKKVKENEAVVSLYLSPLDGSVLEPYRPGQHLMLKVPVPGEAINHFRHYSFSDSYNGQYYRISIKKEIPIKAGTPPGKCSNYLYDGVAPGDVLEAKGPVGDFFLDPGDNTPVTLIAGGIGITPLLSMAKSISEVNPARRVYFFYGIARSAEHAFKDELSALKAGRANFSLTTFYAQCGPEDKRGDDFDHEGFISIEHIAPSLPDPDMQYYICGPAAMMDYVTGTLEDRGVSKDQLHTESFVSSVWDYDDVPLAGSQAGIPEGQEESPITIEFSKSKKTLTWDARYSSILEFAEDHGVEIPSGCLFGDCGTCLTKIIDGEVCYNHPTLVQPGRGECLVCSSSPIRNIVLEA